MNSQQGCDAFYGFYNSSNYWVERASIQEESDLLKHSCRDAGLKKMSFHSKARNGGGFSAVGGFVSNFFKISIQQLCSCASPSDTKKEYTSCAGNRTDTNSNYKVTVKRIIAKRVLKQLALPLLHKHWYIDCGAGLGRGALGCISLALPQGDCDHGFGHVAMSQYCLHYNY